MLLLICSDYCFTALAVDLSLILVTMYTYFAPSVALECTVMAFFCCPILPALLNLAVTKPVLPGITGSFVQFGVVQPQVTSTRSITSGCVPVLVNLKVCSTTSPCAMSPKLCSVASKVSAGPFFACSCGAVALAFGCSCAIVPPATKAAKAKEKSTFFIFIKG